MKDNKFITHISLEDFKKLNPVCYRLEKKYFDRVTNESITDTNLIEMCHNIDLVNTVEDLERVKKASKTLCHKMIWEKVNIIDEVMDSMAETKDDNCVLVAIHTEPTKEELEEIKSTYADHYTDEDLYNIALYHNCYMSRFSTATYDVYMDIDTIYSIRDYWEYRSDDFFRIPKNETKAVYMIHKNA